MGTLIDCSCDKSHNKKHYAIQSKSKANNHKLLIVNNGSTNKNYLKNYREIDRHFNLNSSSSITHEIAYKNYATNKQTNQKNQQKLGKNYKALSDGLWEWSGCDDNVNYGYIKSRDFFDTRMKRRSDLKSLIRLHNSEVGRLTVKAHMRPECKCHGLSGSCMYLRFINCRFRQIIP